MSEGQDLVLLAWDGIGVRALYWGGICTLQRGWGQIWGGVRADKQRWLKSLPSPACWWVMIKIIDLQFCRVNCNCSFKKFSSSMPKYLTLEWRLGDAFFSSVLNRCLHYKRRHLHTSFYYFNLWFIISLELRDKNVKDIKTESYKNRYCPNINLITHRKHLSICLQGVYDATFCLVPPQCHDPMGGAWDQTGSDIIPLEGHGTRQEVISHNSCYWHLVSTTAVVCTHPSGILLVFAGQSIVNCIKFALILSRSDDGLSLYSLEIKSTFSWCEWMTRVEFQLKCLIVVLTMHSLVITSVFIFGQFISIIKYQIPIFTKEVLWSYDCK